MKCNGLNSWHWIFECCKHAQSRGKFFYLPKEPNTDTKQAQTVQRQDWYWQMQHSKRHNRYFISKKSTDLLCGFAFWESEPIYLFFSIYLFNSPSKNDLLIIYSPLCFKPVWLSLFWGTYTHFYSWEYIWIQCIFIISALESILRLLVRVGVRWRCQKVNKSFRFSILAFTGLMNEWNKIDFFCLHIHGYSEIQWKKRE